MIIISHRGYWYEESEKNTEIAFRRSFQHNFGTETDVRDCLGELVISHDLPSGTELPFHSFLSLVDSEQPLLAINIKANGLADLLHGAMKGYNPYNWFVFDMSVPDMRAHLKAGNPVFARMSEVEQQPAWFNLIQGVWLDNFEDEWYDLQLIKDLIQKGKRVCVVSSELHNQDNSLLWCKLRPLANVDQLILCTDTPELAKEYFKDPAK